MRRLLAGALQREGGSRRPGGPACHGADLMRRLWAGALERENHARRLLAGAEARSSRSPTRLAIS